LAEEAKVPRINNSNRFDMQQNDRLSLVPPCSTRDPGVLIVAHSRGKPKTVRLQLTESAITWRTENAKKKGSKDPKTKDREPTVLPAHYVRRRWQSRRFALRRDENAAVNENPQAFPFAGPRRGRVDGNNSPRERMPRVPFSLVLTVSHRLRDIYRGPSSHALLLDEIDQNQQQQQQQHHPYNQQQHTPSSQQPEGFELV
jgi:hypothetical protein